MINRKSKTKIIMVKMDLYKHLLKYSKINKQEINEKIAINIIFLFILHCRDIMRKNNCFVYPKTVRESVDGLRHYDVGKEKLPSVTTILKATESEEKKQGLADWATRIGEDAAEKIVSESAARGTAMHKILEKYILEQGYLDLTNVGKTST